METTCHHILDALSEAITRHDPSSLQITFANRGFAQLLGSATGSAVGKTIREVLGPCQGAAEWEHALRQVQRTRVRAVVAVHLPDQDRHYEVEILPELSAEGDLLALLSVARDASAHRQATEELAHSRQQMTRQHEELSKANGHLENFVYTVAHDLRAPVDNLSVLTNLLLDRPHDDESQLLMEHMQLSVKQLETTIADLVEVLEVQSTYKVVAHQLCLQQVYQEIAAELALDPAAASIEIDFSALPEITYIRSYLLSIFRNMLSNALKYRASGRPLRVTVQARAEDGFAVLVFQDNGIGIDLLNQGHKLFMPFSRLTSQATGKGIGLHLVQNIVQKNGGQIRVESTPDVGTTFTCFLREYE